MNAVILGVLVMLILSVLRINVVLSLIIGAFAGGIAAGLPIADFTPDGASEATKGIMTYFQTGLEKGASTALSYAVLGAFATAIMHSGLPQQATGAIVRKMQNDSAAGLQKVKWILLIGLLAMGIMSQNIVPIHIAFIPMIVPSLLLVFNKLAIDRRLLSCIMTFGLVTTYMFLPYGFGEIFLEKIMLGNIKQAGMDVGNINVMAAMAIPALGMAFGLGLAFWRYRKPRHYENKEIDVANQNAAALQPEMSFYRSGVALVAILVCFATQLIYDNALLLGAMLGFVVFMMMGVVRRKDADDVFNSGIRMMAMIGMIMIAAQGFAEVMKATGAIQPLVDGSLKLFGGSKGMAAFAMLLVGLLVTMGIGSSFSTLPIIAAIYVPLCMQLGFSPLATVAIIGTAGALGDAGSPASDSTLGPTMGLNVDGQHDHMRDSVIPTFIHYNIPLFVFGWIAAMVL
ncbi:Na+/H+ antiporter family protein [Alysiella crassa]|uniref:H+/gluconate symporter and related permeases n=1 Tax=Alysiella crassa TaxID=153491 RepID=A0A376BK42_9NEIS|nr:Na+/H+ antiporter NhaC family protein [Alysiella crassa]SSY70147.1 H+/gluconate symporter and related permeases [Alysiella crassa]